MNLIWMFLVLCLSGCTTVTQKEYKREFRPGMSEDAQDR